jgi:hypothetical protein
VRGGVDDGVLLGFVLGEGCMMVFRSRGIDEILLV